MIDKKIAFIMENDSKKLNLLFTSILILVSIFILFIYLFINQNSIIPDVSYKAQKGYLDLSKYDLKKIGIINLDGEWEFYYDKLYIPYDFENNLVEKPYFVNVPSYWTYYKEVKPKPKIKGYATYRLKVKLDNIYPLGLYLNGVGSAYKLFINGVLYHEKGKVNKDYNKARFKFSSDFVFFTPTSNNLEIVIQVQNKEYFKTGIYNPIRLGLQKKVYNYHYFSLAADIFLFGIIFIMALYNLLIYVLNKKEFYYLFLSIFIFSISYKTLSSNQLFINNLFPNLYLTLDIKIYDFFLFLLLPAFTHYLYFLFPLDFDKLAYKIFNYLSVPIVLSVFIFNISILNYSLIIYEVIALIFILYLIYFIIKINRKKRTLSDFLSYGILLLIVATIFDIINDTNLIHVTSLFPPAMTIFIFIQTVALSYRFMSLYNQVNFLQKRIEEFDSQKIFTNIGKNYSILIHNIKNKINVVSGYKELLSIFLHELEKNPAKINFDKLDNILKMQDKNINELSNTLTNLSYYVKTQIGRVDNVDVNKLLSGVILSYQINSTVFNEFDIKSEFIDKRIFIKANALEFSQIFENLITNSIEACCGYSTLNSKNNKNKKGSIENSNQYKKDQNKNMKINNNKSDKNYKDEEILKNKKSTVILKTFLKNNHCIIEYTDFCGGIPFCNDCDKLNCLDCNVFEIGKSTKIDGSGQGMVYVLNKIKEFNGNLKIISKKGVGTTFIFSFPVLDEF